MSAVSCQLCERTLKKTEKKMKETFSTHECSQTPKFCVPLIFLPDDLNSLLIYQFHLFLLPSTPVIDQTVYWQFMYIVHAQLRRLKTIDKIG